MTPLTPAAVMTEQRLQEMEAWWKAVTAKPLNLTYPIMQAHFNVAEHQTATLIAEVRRLQQANEDDTVLLGTVAGQRDAAMNAHADALGRIQDYILAADASAKERDAVLAERDALKAVRDQMADGILRCIDASWRAGQAHDYGRPELVLAEYVGDVRAALTEARRVLREVMRRSQWKHAAGCYWQHSGAVDEAEDCDCDVRHIKAALAAVLAQEEPR